MSTIHSTKAAEPLGPYSHARRVGNLVFVAGIGPRKRGSRLIPGVKLDAAGKVLDYDIEAEMRSCFENIRIILEEAGSKWENIVDASVFLTDIERDWATYNRVYAEFFPPGPNTPTRTTVEVSALPRGGDAPIHYEMKVIATV
jgi:2-aminomuconate deaminase